MEKYEAKTKPLYGVFGASMTMDTNADSYSGGNLSACRSCQCNCRLCLGGKAPSDAETVDRVDTEGFLVDLLAA